MADCDTGEFRTWAIFCCCGLAVVVDFGDFWELLFVFPLSRKCIELSDCTKVAVLLLLPPDCDLNCSAFAPFIAVFPTMTPALNASRKDSFWAYFRGILMVVVLTPLPPPFEACRFCRGNAVDFCFGCCIAVVPFAALPPPIFEPRGRTCEDSERQRRFLHLQLPRSFGLTLRLQVLELFMSLQFL